MRNYGDISLNKLEMCPDKRPPVDMRGPVSLNDIRTLIMLRDPFQDAAPCWQGGEPVRLLECGCCGCYHPEESLLPGGSANYMNDCRYDANRFNSDEDFTQRTGFPAVEVWLDEQEDEG